MRKLAELTSKMLIGVALALGAGVVGSATAAADPSAFSTLSCDCHVIAPAGSAVRQDAIDRGIRQGESDWTAAPVTRPR